MRTFILLGSSQVSRLPFVTLFCSMRQQEVLYRLRDKPRMHLWDFLSSLFHSEICPVNGAGYGNLSIGLSYLMSND